jgi:hypothetical protein
VDRDKRTIPQEAINNILVKVACSTKKQSILRDVVPPVFSFHNELDYARKRSKRATAVHPMKNFMRPRQSIS